MKDGDERAVRRLIDDPNWEKLRSLLLEHNLLLERHDVPASGRPAAFFHIKNRKALLMWSNPPVEVLPFLTALLNESIRLEGEKDGTDSKPLPDNN